MTASSSDVALPASLGTEAAARLATRLVEEMIERWRAGERPLPEDFFAQYPQLCEHPEAAADLIYEELCLRQEHGAAVPIEEVLCRFPQWRPQLKVLFDCERLLGPRAALPQFPQAGESLDDFYLLAELGRGAQARVFLARQLSLADRPVVLKLTPCDGWEHLSLARLQHTHIMPLYSVHDHPARGLRALCMPYFGGATLAQLFERMETISPAAHTGQDLLVALDEVTASLPQGTASLSADRASGPAGRFLARASYVEAICWLGVCLADALHEAHERDLVHLDLKPSNVLLAADGQPLLLDFHLAREPLDAGVHGVEGLGGTAGYLSPEQAAAMQAIRQGRAVPQPVERRSDIYSLGVVLYEALAGTRPGETCRALPRQNAQVSLGLADVLARCLATDPAKRYPNMAALATDLRRHLAHRPLRGVRNRSLRERWRKWRQRRPHGLALAGMMATVLTATAAVGFAATGHVIGQVQEARSALDDGQVQMAAHQWKAAVASLERGRSAVRSIPFQGALANELEKQLHVAQQREGAASRAVAAHELHRLADQVRFCYGLDQLPTESLHIIAQRCRTFWENRDRVVQRLRDPSRATLDTKLREDLLDLAIFWADLQVRLASPADHGAGKRQAFAILAQAEVLLGPSPVLDAERRLHGGTTRSRPAWPEVTSVETSWVHCALGRAAWRAGDLKRAATEEEQAVRLEPHGLWPNFYLGLCAYRQGRYVEAALAYSVCIGAAPEAAGCYYNRALAFTVLGQTAQALADYDRALELDPKLTAAALNRGMLHYRAGRHAAAAADLDHAAALGAEAARVHYDLALVDLARGDRAAARSELRTVLKLDEGNADAHKLYAQLNED